MNSKMPTWITVIALLVAMAMPVQLAAQDKGKQVHPHQYHHYQINDVGTFGGPNSSFVVPPPAGRLLNNSGTAVGGADTRTPDSASCWNLDCYLSYGFKWQDGVTNKLDALSGFNSSFTFWVSDNGLVAGLSENGIDPLTGLPALEAILWGKDGSITDLGTLGGNDSTANAVNNRAQVAGGALNTILDSYADNFFIFGATQVHAFRWTRSRGMQDLGTLGGTDSDAFFINERGQIAGWSFTNTTVNATTGLPTLDPFFWENGKMLDMGTLGGTLGFAEAMNGHGQVVGSSTLEGDSSSHAFRWDKSGGMLDLGTLGGDAGGANFINDAGEVVGADNTADGLGRAFLWRSGVMTNLGTLGVDPLSEAYGINSKGQVVGHTYTYSDVDLRGFLWEDGGPIVDLNTLIPHNPDVRVTRAFYINDRGEIAAQGGFTNGDTHSLVLIPCDENHRDVEGCDYSMVDAATATQSPAPRYVPTGKRRPPHSRWSNRYHMSGLQSPSR